MASNSRAKVEALKRLFPTAYAEMARDVAPRTRYQSEAAAFLQANPLSITYTARDLNAIERAVENFNAKTRRAAARGVEGLPDPIRVKDVVKGIANRRDFERSIRELQRFSERGSERTVLLDSGVKVSAWEMKEFKRSLAIVNRQRARRLQELGGVEATTRGKPVGLPRGQMHSERMNELLPRRTNPHKARSRSEFNALFRSVRQNSKAGHFAEGDKRLASNYLNYLERNFGAKGRELADKLRGLPTQQIIERMYQDQEGWIKYLSGPGEADSILSDLIQVWNDVPGVAEMGESFQATDGSFTL